MTEKEQENNEVGMEVPTALTGLYVRIAALEALLVDSKLVTQEAVQEAQMKSLLAFEEYLKSQEKK